MLFYFLIALNISPLVNKANKLYKREKYEEAYKLYKKASILNPKNEKIKFNFADCAFELKRFREAGDEFARLVTSKDKDLREKSFYNLGNVFMEAKQYDDAISAYKNALLLNPKDIRAKRNLEIAKMMKKEEKGKSKEKEEKKEKQEQKRELQPIPQYKMNEALKNEQKETMKKALKMGRREEDAGKW
ncbi:MAG: tetratricopeptide repeat protein [candidate division WOR-3 bacterium]